jgi:undecaprenyl-diphosphatase
LDILQALALALIQGITEFLPISSSAHLILPSKVLGWPDQGLAFDVAVHLGSLCAVTFALRQELWRLTTGSLASLAERHMNEELKLVLWVGLGTLPVIIAGLLLKDVVETTLRSALVIAVTTIGFGLLLWYADRRAPPAGQVPPAGRSEFTLTWRDVAVIGLAQCLALVPGTSRSGITMTAALLLGLSRTAAARFSFLLSIPTIAGAAILSLKDLLEAPSPVEWPMLAVGFLAAAVSATLCIHFFLALLERTGFLPYVIYRLVLGAALLLFLL